MEKQKSPEVRFNQFNGSWFEKNLSNEVSFYSGLTYSPNDITNKNGTLVLRSSNVQNGEISLLDNVYVRSEVAYSQNVDEGDIIVVVRNGSRSLIGKHATIKNKMINTVIGAFMTGVKSSQPDFINALFDSNNFTNQVNRNLGATINQITIGAFKEMNFYFPQEEEKVQIGEFFQNLDQSIALHEKKLSQTQNFKKAMLEKMFPTQGSNRPEIRLKGFSGDWQEDILEQLSSVQMCKRIFKSETREKGEIPFYKIGTFGSSPDAFISRALYDEYKEKYPYPEVSDILISASGTIGRTVIYMGEKAYYQDSNIIWLKIDKSKLSNNFLVYFYEIAKWNNVEGSTIKRLYNSDILSTVIKFPSLKEQNAIGSFFRHLDDALVLQNQQLQTLKNIKQAFLEKMFV